MKLKSTAWVLALVMCAAPIAAGSMRPPPPPVVANFLEATVPTTFGEWRKVDEVAQIIDPATKAMLESIYPETLSRTYVNGAGYRVSFGGDAQSAGRPEGVRRRDLTISPQLFEPRSGSQKIQGVASRGVAPSSVYTERQIRR